ncbi:MAG: anaerobic ribonucleoside triphosphate reductase, partial [Oscillospiraceae bacterium]|nr:anaerobic ribonucleoside triphosphate reductase [Oscillospiraceae bacterium]
MSAKTDILLKIRKRDGRVSSFDLDKITSAISRAFAATQGQERREESERMAFEVMDILNEEGRSVPDVEHIQDTVERILIENGYVQTAKAYILYRAERSRAREMNTRLMKIYEDITFRDAEDSDIKRENANIDGDTAMGAMLKYGSEGAKQFYEMFVLKPEHARAHTEGDIHIHDLDFLTLTTTCCQIDLVKLFRDGFSTGHGTLREPNHISSYAALCCIAIQSNQNDQHGGQSVVNFDYAMALGVAKTYVHIYRENLARALEMLCALENADDWAKGVVDELAGRGLRPTMEKAEAYRAAEGEKLLTLCDRQTADKIQDFTAAHALKETDHATYKAMVAFIHNLNTMHSRAGAQTPFSSINYGMDTSPEGRMAVKNVLLATEAGLGHGETPIFPIQIFRVKAGISFNPGDINYDLFKLA